MPTFLRVLIVVLNFIYGYLLESILLYLVGAAFGIFFIVLAINKVKVKWDKVLFEFVIVLMNIAYGFIFSSSFLYLIGIGFGILFIVIAFRKPSKPPCTPEQDKIMTMEEIANARERREQEMWDAKKRSSVVNIGPSSNPHWAPRPGKDYWGS